MEFNYSREDFSKRLELFCESQDCDTCIFRMVPFDCYPEITYLFETVLRFIYGVDL